MTAVRLDRLGPDDAARLAALRLRALAADPDAFFVTHEDERDLPLRHRAEALARPRERWLVAVVAGGHGRDDDVGLAATVPSHADPADLQVVSVWVDAAARGQGVARRLVVELVEAARRDAVPGVRLWVADDNAVAVRLYDDLGFAPTGTTGTFPPPRSFPEHERRLDLGAHRTR